jgi:HAD superfamily hydrolase (TIGR01509 family)
MGTLVHDPFFEEVPAFFGLTQEELFRHKHPTNWLGFEQGILDEETLMSGYFNDGREFDHDAFRQMMKGAYRWLDGMELRVQRLHESGFSMHLFSNYSVWYQLIEERLQLSQWASWSFVSCETGLRKPDHAAFLQASETLGLPPTDCLFIDDRSKNTDAAREIGMDAICFESAAQFDEEISRRGLF